MSLCYPVQGACLANVIGTLTNELGTALRRPGLIAMAEALQPGVVAPTCLLLAGAAADQDAERASEAAAHLNPAAAECLRWACAAGCVQNDSTGELTSSIACRSIVLVQGII